MNPTSPLDILIIEDDDDARDNLRDVLELDDHRVATTGNAAGALALVDRRPFTAIILDRQLPDSTAEVLLPKLRARVPGTAVIVVTGYDDIQGAIAALRQGATDYLLKPINVEILRASLARIAEHRQLELGKERSESAFRHLVEAAECMIIILRIDRSIVYFSPFAERLTSFSDHEVHGRDFVSLIASIADQKPVARAFDQVAAGRPVQSLETPIARKDGTLRWIIWNARPLPDHDGAPATLLVGHDVTSLKEAQERMVQAERLAAIGEVVAGLAHESRNALQRSQACLEMLALAVGDRPAALDLIARIQKAQDHLHHLYEDVRSYAAPFKLRKTRCDLAAVWREAWAHLEPARREKQAVLRESGTGVDLEIQADPFRLEQVFRNILENALAASPIPAEIEIAASGSDHDGGSVVQVAVRDNGPGVSAERRPLIFEPFHTSKAKGTGLGLAIAKRIVDAHGGSIEAPATEHSGAVFVVTLPKGPI